MEVLRKLTNEVLSSPALQDLPEPPRGKTGWPWTQECEALPERMPDGSDWPLVSIVTPCYNHGRFMEECIRSVLLQSYPNLEYIIIDGGSSDESIDIIRKYEPWLSYWESEADRGQSHAINKGLQRCTGKFFNWQNADDLFTPNALESAATAMVTHPQAGYVHGDRINISDKGGISGRTGRNSAEIEFAPSLETTFLKLKAGCQPGCLMDRNLVVQAGLLDENLHYVMDVDILLRVALIRPPIYIAKALNYVRLYHGVKSDHWNGQRARERLDIAEKIFNSRYSLPTSVRKLKRKTFATAHKFAWRVHAKSGNYGGALWHFILDVFYSSGRGWRERLHKLRNIESFSKVPQADGSGRYGD